MIVEFWRFRSPISALTDAPGEVAAHFAISVPGASRVEGLTGGEGAVRRLREPDVRVEPPVSTAG